MGTAHIARKKDWEKHHCAVTNPQIESGLSKNGYPIEVLSGTERYGAVPLLYRY